MKIKSYKDLDAYKKDLGFCKDSQFEEVYQLNQEVIKLLKTYINKLSTKH